MNEIRTRIQVGPDHTITGIAPPGVPPGEHVAIITISPPPIPEKLSRVADLPVHDTPWDGSISLRREDMYGDDGIDTNVLIYATRRTASEHTAAQAALARLESEARSLWISSHILREYLAAVTRPQATSPALPIGTAIADVRRFQQVFYVAGDGPAVLDRLLALLGAHLGAGRQVHDTNIVATMLEYGINRLLTFNAADFRRFVGIIELEPLQ